MPKRGKKYQDAAKLVDSNASYSPEEAVDLVRKTSYAKFDATIEAHLRMGVDPRKADQQIRATVQLPNGTGKEVRVLVFAEGEDQQIALDAGADYAGTDEYIKKIDEMIKIKEEEKKAHYFTVCMKNVSFLCIFDNLRLLFFHCIQHEELHH